MIRFLLASCLLLFFTGSRAQLPAPLSAADILHEMKKLQVVGSVLYVAAHPDDENTRLIAWLANKGMYRTGYLSLTRGDGGQNLIGDEQGADLGLIRTQELLAARRIDGGEQFFTTAQDFGYSKTPTETLAFWEREKLLSDVVYIIRSFRPDVIIARFPEDGRAGHGHHSVSGIMARLGYEQSGDATRFPEQLAAGTGVWQAKRALWNTFNFGGGNTTNESQFNVEVGDYLPLLGKGIGELAGESRSQHKSQGFGVSRQRGTAKEYFEVIGGDRPVNSLMDGVNTTWDRFEGGANIGKQINALLADYDMQDPSKSVIALLQLRKTLRQSTIDATWKAYKLRQVEKLIAACAGLYMEATVPEAYMLSGRETPIRFVAVQRGNAPITLVRLEADDASMILDKPLLSNQPVTETIPVPFKGGVLRTQPYWLRESVVRGMYQVADQRQILQPENEAPSIQALVRIHGEEILFTQPVRYRYVDPVKAEQYQPVHITEPFLVSNGTGLLLFRNNQNDSLTVTINVAAYANAQLSRARVQVESRKTGYERGFTLQQETSATKGMAKVYHIRIPNYLRQTQMEKDLLNVAFLPGDSMPGKAFYNAKYTVAYDHIPAQTRHYQDQVAVLNIDLKTTLGKKIAYLPGAGDKTAEALKAMGYQVTTIGKEDITAEKLKAYDVLVTGVRAYNIHDYLADVYPVLMDYVEQGGNLVVQYNTSNFISALKGKMAPFPMEVGRTRITDEKSPVSFLLPDHPVLNKPNKIGPKDFEGWVQERSIYHATAYDAGKYAAPLAFTDPGEKPEAGALIVAPHGKGHFVYTGMVFFRQLPAAVPGAYRLLANIIEL